MAIRLIEMRQTGRLLQVRRQVDQPDGSVVDGWHVFPIETLAFRAGEYGVPISSPESLLELVLAEGLEEFWEDDEHKATPYLVSAPSADRGRAWHLQRLAAVQAEHAGRPRRTNAQQEAASRVRDTSVREEVVRAADLDPELAELAAELLERDLPAARAAYGAAQAAREALQAVQAAPNGDGTSTLKAELARRLRTDTRRL